jgi:hypothetical protein
MHLVCSPAEMQRHGDNRNYTGPEQYPIHKIQTRGIARYKLLPPRRVRKFWAHDAREGATPPHNLAPDDVIDDIRQRLFPQYIFSAAKKIH